MTESRNNVHAVKHHLVLHIMVLCKIYIWILARFRSAVMACLTDFAGGGRCMGKYNKRAWARE